MTMLRQPAAGQTQTSAAIPRQPVPAVERLVTERQLDARARLLQLQRAVGNRAVAQLLAQRRARRQQAQPAGHHDPGGSSGARPSIQRKVGFEVEMAIPTYRRGSVAFNPSAFGVPDAAISGALTGGCEYDIRLGTISSVHDPAAEIRLKTDKNNKLTNSAQVVYNELGAEPHHKGLPLVPPDGVVKTSILEYDTDALDEMAPGSDAAFKAMATAIDNHAQQIFAADPKKKASLIPNSAPNTATGVPKDKVDDWVSILFARDQLQTAVSNMGAVVEWRMFPQATVGVLPSSLTVLYLLQQQKLKSRGESDPGSVWGVAYDAVSGVVQGITDLWKDGAISEGVNEWLYGKDTVGGDASDLDRSAVTGGMALSLSYAIGNTLNCTSLITSTEKNLVPLLVKLANIGGFTTQATTNWLRNNPPKPKLINDIAVWFHANVPQATLKHWTDPPYKATVVVPKARLYGTGEEPFRATRSLMWNIFTGKGGHSPLGSSHPINADPVSDVIGGSGGVSGQAGLPLEYRWIPDQPTGPGQLWTQVFEPVLTEVRLTNLQHIPQDQWGDIEATW